MSIFVATGDFAAALYEVDMLLERAAESEADMDATNTYTKAAILLLSGKLESFMEHIVEEYCFQLGGLHLVCSGIPAAVRAHASKQYLGEDVLMALGRGDGEKYAATMRALGALWVDGCAPVEVKVDTTFAYGKHGEKEIRRLFSRIGLADVFAACLVPDTSEALDDPEEKEPVSAAPDINALTGYRNYIIHNDGTPNVTHVQIRRYRDRVLAFSERVDAVLLKMRDLLKPTPVGVQALEEA